MLDTRPDGRESVKRIIAKPRGRVADLLSTPFEWTVHPEGQALSVAYARCSSIRTIYGLSSEGWRCSSR